MKKIVICALACSAPLLVTAAEIVVPDMELGHWITTADTSAMLEQTLASIPKESREMVRKMMKEKMEESTTTEQCVTKESLSNFDQQIENAFGQQDNCEYKIDESTNKKLSAILTCAGSSMLITTVFTSSKRNESTVVSKMAGVEETKISTVAEWQSSSCPEGL